MITLSPEQGKAVDVIIKWYVGNVIKPCMIAGYAGTGKSTLVKYVIDALGIPFDQVRYLTFTGKASLVLQRMGNNAQTIHSFIYEPKVASYRDHRGIMKQKIVGFKLRDQIDDQIKLLVVDEISMVSEHLLRDIRKFKVKILALGDPGQLSPVMGASNTLMHSPDVFLDKIHRQAANNPIIWACDLARRGLNIPYGTHGQGQLRVIPINKVNLDELLPPDQIIVCRHVNRIKFNLQIREFMGYEPGLPQPGEKLVCLKNNWHMLSSISKTPLINGLTCSAMTAIKTVRRQLREFDMAVEVDGCPGDVYPDVTANLDFFDPRSGVKADTDGRMDHFDFGHVITGHRAQGSQWGRVLYVHDGFGSATDLRQQLYTGSSRAISELVIAK